MSWLLAFLGFAVLVVLHEAGHFFAAKAVGMRVERFSLFFPPLVWKWKPKGSETEYAIGSIPLGGYVKITGMTPDEEIPPEVEHRAYYKQDVWRRIVTIVAGPLVNVVLCFLILWVIFMSHGLANPNIVGVGVTDEGSPAAQVLREDDRILSVDGVPGYREGQTEAQVAERAKAIRTQMNTHTCKGGAKVDGCVAETPAIFEILRDGKRMKVEVRPEYSKEAKRMLAGFGFGGYDDIGAIDSARETVDGMWRVTTTTVDRITALVYDSKARDEVSGVVGSYEATRQSFDFDTIQAFQVLALISLSLGIVNLFPFLPLDGGHIFWALAEKVRGKPISYELMARASIVGIMLIVALFLLGLTNDIGRISGDEGFGVR